MDVRGLASQVLGVGGATDPGVQVRGAVTGIDKYFRLVVVSQGLE